MGKLGVGIGDEFPVDDPKGPTSGETAGPGDSAPRDPEIDKLREEYRKARDAWREQRRKLRDAWRERRHAERDDMRRRYGDSFSSQRWDEHFWHYHWRFDPRHIANLLLIVGLIVLAIVIFSHIYILFGLIVLAGLYFAYRGGFERHFDLHDPPHSAPTAPPSPPAAS